MESLSNSFNIASVETSNRDSTILGHIDCMFLSKNVYLLNVQTGVGKHTDLGGDVVPVKLAAFLG